MLSSQTKQDQAGKNKANKSNLITALIALEIVNTDMIAKTKGLWGLTQFAVQQKYDP